MKPTNEQVKEVMGRLRTEISAMELYERDNEQLDPMRFAYAGLKELIERREAEPMLDETLPSGNTKDPEEEKEKQYKPFTAIVVIKAEGEDILDASTCIADGLKECIEGGDFIGAEIIQIKDDNPPLQLPLGLGEGAEE